VADVQAFAAEDFAVEAFEADEEQPKNKKINHKKQ